MFAASIEFLIQLMDYVVEPGGRCYALEGKLDFRLRAALHGGRH
jgi:hypothetical protein